MYEASEQRSIGALPVTWSDDAECWHIERHLGRVRTLFVWGPPDLSHSDKERDYHTVLSFHQIITPCECSHTDYNIALCSYADYNVTFHADHHTMLRVSCRLSHNVMQKLRPPGFMLN